MRNNPYEVARLSALKSVPRVGSILWVDSAELRWTHDKIQRLVIVDVVWRMSCRGILLPCKLCLIKIVHYESKRYSHNQSASFKFSGLKFTVLVE